MPKLKLYIWCLAILAILLFIPARLMCETKSTKKAPTLTDQVMLNSIKSLLELGEEPSPGKVVELSKEKIESWNYYFERAALHGHLKGSGLIHQKTKALKMMQEIDRRAAEARRQNRPSAAKRVFRFITSPIRGPVKLVGKISGEVEKILPPFARPIFRALVGHYTLKKYRTLLKALAVKHSTPQLMKALDVWRSVLIVQENPGLISKFLQGRLKELGRDEIGQIIARVTERALGRLPGDEYGNLMKQLLVFQAEELKNRFSKSWGKQVDRNFDRNLERKITNLSERIVKVFPDKRLKKELDDAAAEFDKYIISTVSGAGTKTGTKTKAYKMSAAFSAEPTSGTEPLTVSFDASESSGPISKYVWDFGDGKPDKEGVKVQNTFNTHSEKEEKFEVILSVYAPDKSSATAKKYITVKKDTRLDLKIIEFTVTPNSARRGQTVKLNATVVVKGAESGNYKYKFLVDDVNVKAKSGGAIDLDYDQNYFAEYIVSKDISGGQHTAKFEIEFEVGKSDNTELKGKQLKARAEVNFTVQSEASQPKAVFNCPVPEGAKLMKNEHGWSYYLDGIQVGPYISYDADDTLDVWRKGCFDENGRRTGIQEEYYEKGKLKFQKEYQNGVLHGKTIEYHENGKMESERMFKEGLLNGPSIFYYEDGKKSAIVTFKDSILNGETVYWEIDENGRYKEEDKIYQNDTIIYQRSYHRNGQVQRELTRKYSGQDKYENVKYFDKNGVKTQDCNYLNNKKHGSCFSILEYNYQMMTENCTYNNGKEINCQMTPLPNYHYPD